MLHSHAVGVARKLQRQQRHVQHSIAITAQLFQPRRAIAAQDAIGLLGGKAVVAGRHRRVRSEHALLPHQRQIGFRRRAQRPSAQLALDQRQRQQRRVALIHVEHVYPQAQSTGQPYAAHAQHDLLLQTVIRVAAIQVIGKPAIPPRVAVDIRVEQIDRNDVPVAAHHIVAPGAHSHDAVFHAHRDARRLLGAEVRRIPRLHIFALHAIQIQMLLEVSLAMRKRERHQWNAQVGSGAQRVSC